MSAVVRTLRVRNETIRYMPEGKGALVLMIHGAADQCVEHEHVASCTRQMCEFLLGEG